jgi:hypothetical protein
VPLLFEEQSLLLYRLQHLPLALAVALAVALVVPLLCAEQSLVDSLLTGSFEAPVTLVDCCLSLVDSLSRELYASRLLSLLYQLPRLL